MARYNQDAWRMVGEKVAEVASSAQSGAEATAATALAVLFKGTGGTLPTTATATVGQLFLRTGTTSPGLYVCSASTSSASTWKAVTFAS